MVEQQLSTGLTAPDLRFAVLKQAVHGVCSEQVYIMNPISSDMRQAWIEQLSGIQKMQNKLVMDLSYPRGVNAAGGVGGGRDDNWCKSSNRVVRARRRVTLYTSLADTMPHLSALPLHLTLHIPSSKSRGFHEDHDDDWDDYDASVAAAADDDCAQVRETS